MTTDGWCIGAPAGALCAVSMRNLVPAVAMEVTDLTRLLLPATLFSIPDGYAEVKRLKDLAKPILDTY